MSKSAVAGGAMSGAGYGSRFGPIGTGVGAGVGALVGWLGSRNKDKQKKGYDAMLQQMLQQQMQQYQQQQPLRDAVQSQAMNRLRAVYPNGVPGLPQTAAPPLPSLPAQTQNASVEGLLRLLVTQQQMRPEQPWERKVWY